MADLPNHLLRIDKVIHRDEIEIRMKFLPVQMQGDEGKDHKPILEESHEKQQRPADLPVQPAGRQTPEEQCQGQRKENAGCRVVDQSCQKGAQHVPGCQGHHVQ